MKKNASGDIEDREVQEKLEELKTRRTALEKIIKAFGYKKEKIQENKHDLEGDDQPQ